MTPRRRGQADDEFWERVRRYYDGTLAPADREGLEGQLAGDPRLRAQVRRVLASWAAADVLGRRDGSLDAQEALNIVLDRISASPGDARQSVRLDLARATDSTFSRKSSGDKRPSYRLPFAVVTALAGAAAIVAALRSAGISLRLPVMRSVHLSAAAGQQRHAVLPDGSQLTLAPATELQFVERLGGGRDVYLSGEAYFNVTHRARSPFVVTVGSTIIRDVGTVFAVRAYPSEPVRVVVQSGSVSVNTLSRSVPANAVLRAGDLVEVADTGDVQVHHGVVLRDYFAWTDGTLRFRNARLREVVSELERRFDLSIALSTPSLGDEALTVSIEHATADDALRILGELVHATITRHGRSVLITAKQRANR